MPGNRKQITFWLLISIPNFAQMRIAFWQLPVQTSLESSLNEGPGKFWGTETPFGVRKFRFFAFGFIIVQKNFGWWRDLTSGFLEWIYHCFYIEIFYNFLAGFWIRNERKVDPESKRGRNCNDNTRNYKCFCLYLGVADIFDFEFGFIAFFFGRMASYPIIYLFIFSKW